MREALSSAATPETAVDAGREDKAAPAQGSATATSSSIGEERRQADIWPDEVAAIGRQCGFAEEVRIDVASADVERAESCQETGLDHVMAPGPYFLAVAAFAKAEVETIRIERGAANAFGATVGDLAERNAEAHQESTAEVDRGSGEPARRGNGTDPCPSVGARARAEARFDC